jgi:large conductance mechanosensitive channel
MLKEFKEFAMRGNVVDLAVGVVIGGAFGKIVTSLVDQMIMPVVGVLTGGVDFSKLQLAIAHSDTGAVTAAIGYGAFINTIVQFIIVAFALFLVVKAMSAAKKKEAVAEVAATPPAQEVLLAEIRDLLKKK